MAISERTFNRLYNWKFESALEYMLDDTSTDYTEEEKDIILALSAMFGDSGWFEGYMAEIVRAALLYIDISDDE